jgi:O-antigen ligase
MFIVICSLLLAAITYFSPKTFYRQFEQSAIEVRYFSSTSYGIIYNSALESIHQNFWLGTGAKQFNAECRKNGVLNTKNKGYCEATSHPHNLYLEIFSNAGAIGVIPFLFFLYLLTKNIYLNRHLILNNTLATGATILIIIKLMPAPVSSFYLAWSMAPFWLMIGIVMSYRKEY